MEEGPTAPGGGESGSQPESTVPSDLGASSRWEQRAGFSVFFDVSVDELGSETWQTRIYHEEADEETVVATADARVWAAWVADRVGSFDAGTPRRSVPADGTPSAPSAAVHQLIVEVVAVRMVDSSPPRSWHDREAALLQVELRVAGLADLQRTLGAVVMAAVVAQSSPTRSEVASSEPRGSHG